MENGSDSNGIVTSRDMVNAANLTCYFDRDDCTTPPDSPAETAQSIAHAYGEIAQSQISCPYYSDGDIQSAPQNCSYFHDANTFDDANTLNMNDYAVRYLEYNAQDSSHSYPFRTNRTVKVSSGKYYEYSVDAPEKIDGPDGEYSKWV